MSAVDVVESFRFRISQYFNSFCELTITLLNNAYRRCFYTSVVIAIARRMVAHALSVSSPCLGHVNYLMKKTNRNNDSHYYTPLISCRYWRLEKIETNLSTIVDFFICRACLAAVRNLRPFDDSQAPIACLNDSSPYIVERGEIQGK